MRGTELFGCQKMAQSTIPFGGGGGRDFCFGKIQDTRDADFLVSEAR